MACKLLMLDLLSLLFFYLMISFMFHHVLHVAHITKNLLSFSKLLTDNNVVVEFVDNTCYIKANNTGIILLKKGLLSKACIKFKQFIHSPDIKILNLQLCFLSKPSIHLSLFLLIGLALLCQVALILLIICLF